MLHSQKPIPFICVINCLINFSRLLHFYFRERGPRVLPSQKPSPAPSGLHRLRKQGTVSLPQIRFSLAVIGLTFSFPHQKGMCLIAWAASSTAYSVVLLCGVCVCVCVCLCERECE